MESTGKNGIAAFAHAGQVAQFIGKAEPVENTDHIQEFIQALRLDDPENFPASVANAYGHDVAPGERVAGIIRKGGRNFLIVGQRMYALDELCSHGVLSMVDRDELVYLGKFLMATVKSAIEGETA